MPCPKRSVRAWNSCAWALATAAMAVTADSAAAARARLIFMLVSPLSLFWCCVVQLLGVRVCCSPIVLRRAHSIAEQADAFNFHFTHIARPHVETGFSCMAHAGGRTCHNHVTRFEGHHLAEYDDEGFNIEHHVSRVG